ncbi:hypothetical protein C3L33_06451, partial [Rhododendron williamsianum]
MASVFSLHQLSCKTLSKISPPSQFNSKPALSPPNSINFNKTPLISSLKISGPGFRVVRAVPDNEWGPEKEEGAAAGVAVAVAEKEPPAKEPTEIELLKKQLVDSFYGTDRGLRATSETRAEIVELITKLEAKNPTPAPTEALTLLDGKWILAVGYKLLFFDKKYVLGPEKRSDVELTLGTGPFPDVLLVVLDFTMRKSKETERYTSFVGLFPLLSRTLALVKVEEISQTIDSENFTVQNSVLFSGPLATTSLSTNAKFEVRSPKRVQIKFEEGIIGTPQLTDSIVLPENVEFLGTKIDFTPFKGLITSVQDTASSVAKTISSQPPLKFSISNTNTESWLLTTYLDEELRISRGDAGSIFVLIKEGSPLLTL